MHYARSLDGGSSWGDEVAVSDDGDEDEAWTPALAVWGSTWDNHEVFTEYFDEDERPSEEQVYSICYRRNDSCGEPDNNKWLSRDHVSGFVSTWEEECFRPSVATCLKSGSDYNAHSVWQDSHDDLASDVIWYDKATFTPGQSGSTATLLAAITNDDGYDDMSPSVAACYSGGGVFATNFVHVVYYAENPTIPGHDEVWYLRSTNSGSGWSTPVNLSSTTGFESQAPSIAISGTNVYVVWQEENADDQRFRIRFRRSTNQGVSWGTATDISDSLLPEEDQNTPPECFTPSIACYGNYVYVVCQGGWTSYGVGFIMSSDNGSTWVPEDLGGYTDEEPDLEVGDAGLFPTIAVSNGDGATLNKYLSVVYSGIDGNGDTRVYYLRRNEIDEVPDGGQSAAGALRRVARLDVQPSVFQGQTDIRVTLGTPAAFTVSIYDASGQLVRSFGGRTTPLTARLAWDGTDDCGSRVAVGTYLICLRSGGGTATRRVQLVRR